MRLWIIGLLLILPTVSGTSVPLESVVYDFMITEDEIDGYCKIVAKEGRVNFTPPLDAVVVKESRSGMILSIRKSISGNELELPLLVFPYGVKKTIVGVEAPESKFLWRVNFPTESKEDDRVLVQKYLSKTTVKKLDNELYGLRKHVSRSSKLPEYRLYLGEIGANEKPEVEAWVGKVYEYYLPYAVIAVVLSAILFSVFYVISKRL